MAWSPPALIAGIVWVSAPGDYATLNSNHTPDGTRGFELIVLVQLEEGETLSESIRAESDLSCLSDPSTRVIDLKPALSEMKAKDLTRYNRMYVWRFTEGHIIPGHMSAEGNQFVALEILKVLTQSLPAALR